jgi:hypothetical protein
MSNNIMRKLIPYAIALVFAIPIAPAKAQMTGGFNPNASDPLSGLGSILGNSGGPLGGDPTAGGLFGGGGGLGDLGNLGNLGSDLGGLTGGNSSSSGGGGDLVSILQNYLQGFIKMATSAIGEAIGSITGDGSNMAGNGSMPKDPGLGDTLSHVTTAMKSNTGGLGLPDYAKSRDEALTGAKNNKNKAVILPFSGINLATLQPGQISFKTTLDFNNTVLGKDAQERHVKAMEAITKSIGGVSQLSQASGQSAKKSAQASQKSTQAAQSVAQVAQKSTSSASSAVSLAGKAKSAISTQDVVKFQAEQTGELANILAGVSTQLGGNSTQLASVSTELAELSGQQSQQSGQLKEISAINGDQAVSLRSIQVGQAVANVNLSDINQGNQGDRQRKLLESQADTMLLSFSNGFRLAR